MSTKKEITYNLNNFLTTDKTGISLRPDFDMRFTTWDLSSDTYLYDNSPPPKPWVNKLEFSNHLSKVIDLWGDKIDNFYLFDNLEVYNIDNLNYPSFEYLRILKKIFEKNNLMSKLTFCSNNAIGSYKEFKFRPITTFLGYHNRIEQYPPYGRKFYKKFLYMNRKPRVHRIEFFKKLLNSNMIDNSYYSINSHDSQPETLGYAAAIESNLTPVTLEGTVFDINPYYFTTSFLNLVTETAFKTHQEYFGDCVFITEKTDKAIRFGQPFIILSHPNFLKELKSLGFKTFDRWWDETYDTILDDDMRMNAVVKLVEDINNWDFEKITNTYKEMEEVLTHNQKVRSYILNYKINNTVLGKKSMEQNTFVFYDDLKNYLNMMLNN